LQRAACYFAGRTVVAYTRGSSYPNVASLSSMPTRPPLAPGTNVTQGLVRLDNTHPVWGISSGKAAWADLEDSSTEEKELNEQGAHRNRPNNSRAEATAEPSNALVSAKATPSAAMFGNVDINCRYKERGPSVCQMAQDVSEGKCGIFLDGNTTDLSGSSNTILSSSQEFEERHLGNKLYGISALSGSSSVTSSSFKVESDIETLSSQDDQVPEVPAFTQRELELMTEHVPRDEDGNPTSKGSILHDQGECTPCLFVHRNVGCQNGVLCTFCHFPHKRRAKSRPCKDKRDRFQKRVEHMENKMDAEPHRIVEDPTWLKQLVQEIAPSVESNPALEAKVMAKLHRHATKLLADHNLLTPPEAAPVLDGARLAQSSCTTKTEMAQPLTGSRAGVSTKTSL